MTTFLDGPAKGQRLMLKHSPKDLRVVEKEGQWDALDSPNDEPRSGETVHHYRLRTIKGTAHINTGRGRGGFYPIAEYAQVT
jgi:hypothetical protein